MRHTLPLMFLVGLTACGPKQLPYSAAPTADYKPAHLEGNWVDSGGTHYTFDAKGNATTVIDHDGEFFPVSATGTTNEGLTAWTYEVPSTGFTVTHVVTAVGGSRFDAIWTNGENEGAESFSRE